MKRYEDSGFLPLGWGVVDAPSEEVIAGSYSGLTGKWSMTPTDFGAASAVILYCLNEKGVQLEVKKLSIYLSTYIPTLINGHELWEEMERIGRQV